MAKKKKNIFKILVLLKDYKGSFVLSTVLSIFHAFFEILSILLLIPVIEMLFKEDLSRTQLLENAKFTWDQMTFDNSGLKNIIGKYISEIALQYPDLSEGKMQALLFLCALIIVSFLFKNIFRYFSLFTLIALRTKVLNGYRKQAFKRIINLDLSYFTEQKKGEILTKLSSDIQEIEWSVMSFVIHIIKEPMMIIIIFVLLFKTNLSLSLFTFLFLPAVGGLIAFIGKKIKNKSVGIQEKMGLIISTIEESLGAIRIIRAFNAAPFVNKKFSDAQDDYQKAYIHMNRVRDIGSPLSELMGIMTLTVVIGYGGFLVFNKEMGGEDFMAFVALFYTLTQSIKKFSEIFFHLKKGSASIERVEEITNIPVKITNQPNAKVINGVADKIEFDHISFSYDGEHQVLHEVNFEVKRGQTVALVGQSGSGKTTISNLLPRFYEVGSGSIKIDGTPLQEIELESLRESIGMVTQDSILFNDTIFNNITFGNSKATKEDVIKAAQIANAHDFISSFPDGYDTNIGDGGGKLSGGQKQRLSIARAVLKNPPIMILDEATSALDTESEKLVQDALEHLMENRTSVVIAHRLSTIAKADKIIVMQDGKIIEEGTHEGLLAKNGAYKKLTELQSFE